MKSDRISPERIALRKKYPISFGRIKSRSLNQNQMALMKSFYPEIGIFLEGDSIKKLISETKTKKLAVEIGFGDGEHMVHFAKNNPDTIIVGCEVFKNSFVVGLQKTHKEKLENIRMFLDDSRYLLEKLPQESIDKIFILFPDPWPKQKQMKRRIVNKQNIELIYPLLKNKGKIRLATDIDSYFEQMLNVFEGDKRFEPVIKQKDFAKVPSGHIETKYQQKALNEGRIPRFLEYVKR